MNAADSDAADWIKIFTFLTKPEVDILMEEHAASGRKSASKKDWLKR
jgi:hypothetical protein